MNRVSRCAMASACVLATVELGCDPQASALYRGEPLLRISGLVVDRAPATAPEPISPELGLAWIAGPRVETIALDAELNEESWFTAGIYDPPPESMMIACEEGTARETELAFAWILAARPGVLGGAPISLANLLKMRKSGEVLGWARDTVIVYAARDVQEPGAAAKLLGGPVARGAHAMTGVHALRASTAVERSHIELAIREGSQDGSTPFAIPGRCDSTAEPIRTSAGIDETPAPRSSEDERASNTPVGASTPGPSDSPLQNSGASGAPGGGLR